MANFRNRFTKWASRRLAVRHLTGRYHELSKEELQGIDWKLLMARHLNLHHRRGGVVEHFYWTPSLALPSVIGIIGWTLWLLPLAMVAELVGGLVGRSGSAGLVWAGGVMSLAYVLQLAWSTVGAIRQMFTQPTTVERFRRQWDQYGSEHETGSYTDFLGPFTSLWRRDGEFDGWELWPSVEELLDTAEDRKNDRRSR